MNNIRSVLKHQYDVDIADIVPQQGGWSTLAYKVSDMNQRYFLKVYEKSRASTPKLTALIDQYMPIMVWLMHNSNLKGNITVPLLTVNGEYKCEDDVGIYLLYDYIDGETIGNRKLTEDQIQQFSEIIASLHFYGEEIPIETDSIKEDFQVPFLQLFRDILNDENKHIAGGVRKVVSPYVKQINDLVNTVEKLAIYLKNSDLKMALCHTDLHYWNLMESEEQLVLIDWEGLKLAPVEADLMFLVDKPYFHTFLKMYQKTHQNFKLNPDALHFYQGRRKLEDIGEFMEQLLFDSLNEQERVVTMNYLKEELRTISG